MYMYEADSEGPAYVRSLGTCNGGGSLDDDDGFGSLPAEHTRDALTTGRSFMADLWKSCNLSRAWWRAKTRTIITYQVGETRLNLLMQVIHNCLCFKLLAFCSWQQLDGEELRLF